MRPVRNSTINGELRGWGMTTKYTKGPWFGLIDGKYNNSKNNWRAEDEEAGCSEAAPITTQDGTVIALVVASGDAYFDEDRVSDNARLIAAAPDLLEALKKLLEEKDDYMRRNNLGDPMKESVSKIARAAIAKAEGRA